MVNLLKVNGRGVDDGHAAETVLTTHFGRVRRWPGTEFGDIGDTARRTADNVNGRRWIGERFALHLFPVHRVAQIENVLMASHVNINSSSPEKLLKGRLQLPVNVGVNVEWPVAADDDPRLSGSVFRSICLFQVCLKPSKLVV